MSSLPLRVIVCDDELMARKRVLRLLSELPGIEATIECESGEEVLAKLRTEDVDVALLDINMPGISGLETVMQMPEERPYVIFLTAHPEHAVSAFDVGAVDYVLKPVDDTRLAKALTRARQFLDFGGLGGLGGLGGMAGHSAGNGSAPGDGAGFGPAGHDARPAPRLHKLAVATRDGVSLVNPGDITHATFDGALVTIHTATRTILTDDTLQDLEAKLVGPNSSAAVGAGMPGTPTRNDDGGGPFERVHRRAILNLDHVDRLQAVDSGGYAACLSTGKKVDVSRQSARRLRRRLGLR